MEDLRYGDRKIGGHFSSGSRREFHSRADNSSGVQSRSSSRDSGSLTGNSHPGARDSHPGACDAVPRTGAHNRDPGARSLHASSSDRFACA